MNFERNIQISFVGNINLDDSLRGVLDKEYKNLPIYEFSDQFEEDDEYVPTLLSILVPFNNYHVIVTIHFTYGSFDLKVSGIIADQLQISDRIVLCNLWVLSDCKVNYQVIDMFWGVGDYGDPAPVDYLFVTERTISKIFELLLDYYLGGDRPMYKCNPECEEDNQLDI